MVWKKMCGSEMVTSAEGSGVELGVRSTSPSSAAPLDAVSSTHASVQH